MATVGSVSHFGYFNSMEKMDGEWMEMEKII